MAGFMRRGSAAWGGAYGEGLCTPAHSCTTPCNPAEPRHAWQAFGQAEVAPSGTGQAEEGTKPGAEPATETAPSHAAGAVQGLHRGHAAGAEGKPNADAKA